MLKAQADEAAAAQKALQEKEFRWVQAEPLCYTWVQQQAVPPVGTPRCRLAAQLWHVGHRVQAGCCSDSVLLQRAGPGRC